MLADRVRMGGRGLVRGWVIEELDGMNFKIEEPTSKDSMMSKPFTVPKDTQVYFSVEDKSFEMEGERREEVTTDFILFRNSDTAIIDGKKYKYKETDSGDVDTISGVDTDENDTEHFLAGRVKGIYEYSTTGIHTGYYEYEDNGPILLTSGDKWRLLLKGHGKPVASYSTTEFYLKDATNNRTLARFTYYYVNVCYLTTCMVGYYGKDDNGIELNSMRKLREKYKIKHKDTLAEYYRVSPLIIKGIEQSGNKEYWYNEIKKVVDKIVVWVANKEWEKAEIAYLKLYYKLKNIFCSGVK